MVGFEVSRLIIKGVLGYFRYEPLLYRNYGDIIEPQTVPTWSLSCRLHLNVELCKNSKNLGPLFRGPCFS